MDHTLLAILPALAEETEVHSWRAKEASQLHPIALLKQVIFNHVAYSVGQMPSLLFVKCNVLQTLVAMSFCSHRWLIWGKNLLLST